jgi:mRNA-degrading endonuclease HigB of HigAB toxin-antitoxin module
MSFIAVGSAVVAAGAAVMQGVNNAQSNKESLKLQNIQNQLDLVRQKDLDKATLKVNNDNTKLKILADSVANIKSSQQQTLMTAQSLQQQAEKKNLVILGIGGGVIIVGAIAVLKLA